MKSVTSYKRVPPLSGAQFFGVAVRGPLHRKVGHPCEDSWKGSHFANALAVAIGDGMGSKPSARHGALAATATAIRAARLWSSTTSVEPEWICRWLEAQWRFAVAPKNPQECATTCHLLVAHKQAGLVYVGLGDGLVLFQEGHRPVQCLSSRREGHFLNETVGLGVNHRMADWTQVKIPLSGKPWIAILATDGIADDIHPDKLNVFVKWLRGEIACKKGVRRTDALRRALHQWPTPGHFDDKTVAVLSNL